MRLVITILLAAAAPVAAQPAAAPALAPGEVLLELGATGESHVPADRARIVVMITARGADSTEARSALEGAVRQVTAAAVAAGVATTDVRSVRRSPSLGFVGNEAPSEDPTQFFVGAGPRGFASQMLEVIVRNPARADVVRTALDQAGVGAVSDPVYRTEHEDEARRAARADGLARARADAEDYAAATGMRVARITRINERMPTDTVGWAAFSVMMRRGFDVDMPAATGVETQVYVSVDFVLAPR